MSKEAEARLLEQDLAGTLAALQEHVRGKPASVEHRVFLFQLLTILGQWDRALTQLNVAAEMDAVTLGMAVVYRPAVRCELLRAAVFAGQQTPLIFGEPEPWVILMVEALRLSTDGDHEAAAAARAEALESAPGLSGSLTIAEGDGEATHKFDWIADADSRLGPILSAVINGKYYWVPLTRVRHIKIEPPTDLRDFVWTMAHVEWTNGGESPVLIPTRYVGSENSENDAIRLARQTEWTEPSPDFFCGIGQRILTTDTGDHPLLQIRSIRLDPTADGGSEETDA